MGRESVAGAAGVLGLGVGVALDFAGNLGPVFLAGLPLYFGVVFVVVMCFNS